MHLWSASREWFEGAGESSLRERVNGVGRSNRPWEGAGRERKRLWKGCVVFWELLS